MNQRGEIPTYSQFFRSADDDGKIQDSCNDPSDIRNQQYQGKLRQNQIEKTLNKALQKPLVLGKGESMMKKMGWSGGGLGRLGEGIVEPIAPNAAYAMKKQGLGIVEVTENRATIWQESFSHSHGNGAKKVGIGKQKQNLKPKGSQFTKKLLNKSTKNHSKKIFISTILEQLFEFVRNEKQVELLLDKKLTNVERKLVHNLVEEINRNTLDSYTMEQVDLIQSIIEFNEFDLHTESFGIVPNRQLGIFKDAKDYMYLVIPEDLREDEIMVNDGSEQGNTNNSQCIIDGKTIKNEEMIDLVEKDENSSNSCGFTEKDTANEETSEKNCNNTEEIMNKALSENFDKIKNQNTQNLLGINDSITSDSDENDKSLYQLLFKKGEFTNDKKFRKELANEEENFIFKDLLAKNGSNKSFTVEVVLKKVVDYFMDFINDDNFTEFRFLGSFNETEYEAVGIFFDICGGDTSENSEVANKLRQGLKSDTYCYSLDSNCNGSTILQKQRKG